MIETDVMTNVMTEIQTLGATLHDVEPRKERGEMMMSGAGEGRIGKVVGMRRRVAIEVGRRRSSALMIEE